MHILMHTRMHYSNRAHQPIIQNPIILAVPVLALDRQVVGSPEGSRASTRHSYFERGEFVCDWPT